MARSTRNAKRKQRAAEDNPTAFTSSLVIVCEGQRPIGPAVTQTCEALGIRVEVMNGCARLFEFLHYMQPSAVISDLVLAEQDGFDVMKIVAGYNRDLPLLMVTSDPILLGAVDAIEELWSLSNVWRLEAEPTAGVLAEFLYRSGVLRPLPDVDEDETPMRPALSMPEAIAAE